MNHAAAARSGFPAPAAPMALDQKAGWAAELSLEFAVSHGRTRLVRRSHRGPLMVQRPFHPEADGTCHVYVLHPPGGVAGGDSLDIGIEVGPDARCVLTTPGATKFYRSIAGASYQRVEVAVAPGGICEHLPQETIVFDGAAAKLSTQVGLQGNATFIGWDFICLGRPAAGERLASGHVAQGVDIRRDGRRIWFERVRLDGSNPVLEAPFALAGQAVFGTLVCAAPEVSERALDAVRAAAQPPSGSLFSASRLQDVIACRYLGPQAAIGKALFSAAWGAIRQTLQDKPSCPPRIWAT